MGNLSNRKPFPKINQDLNLLEFFKEMGKIRKEEKFLKTAETEIKDINERHFIFERYNNSKILIAVNRLGEETEFNVPEEYKNPSKIYTLNKSKPGTLTPYGALAIKK